MTSYRLFCCVIGCNADAEWEIWDGESPYFDHFTHACTDHVGALLSDTREHHVYPVRATGLTNTSDQHQ